MAEKKKSGAARFGVETQSFFHENPDGSLTTVPSEYVVSRKAPGKRIGIMDGTYDTEDKAREAASTLQRETRGMKKGGSVSSASRRADGIAQRGKTRGKLV